MAETPGKRVGATGRGRGRAHEWHRRETVRLRQGGQTYRQGREREGEWEGRQAREGAQGSGTGVARRRAGGTRRARGSSGERENGTKKNNSRTGGHTGRTHRGGRVREVGGTGGKQGHKGTQRLSQRSTMPMTRIQPYRAPRPTIRELMEGRPAGEDDGGVSPKGCPGRPPRSAYRLEDRAEAQSRATIDPPPAKCCVALQCGIFYCNGENASVGCMASPCHQQPPHKPHPNNKPAH